MIRKTSEWVNTSSDVVSATSITKYILTDPGSDDDDIAEYELKFVSTKGGYSYVFHDESGTRWSKLTLSDDEEHSIDYDSRKPAIVAIEYVT